MVGLSPAPVLLDSVWAVGAARGLTRHGSACRSARLISCLGRAQTGPCIAAHLIICSLKPTLPRPNKSRDDDSTTGNPLSASHSHNRRRTTSSSTKTSAAAAAGEGGGGGVGRVSGERKMSFRAREMYKKVVRRVGGEGKLPAELMASVKNLLPDSKVVMGRAKRGIYAGRHIQFGNKVSEDGGNK